MSNDLVVQDRAIALLEEGKELTGVNAWDVAQYINDAESDVRLAKGRFWNRCKRGTREEICDTMGWKYSSMEMYSQYARQIHEYSWISYQHWMQLYSNRIEKEVRPEWFKKIKDNNWTPKDLRVALDSKETEEVKEIVERQRGKVFPQGTTKKEMLDENKRLNREEAKQDYKGRIRKKDTTISIIDACEFLGLSTLTWITQDTLDCIYKCYSKSMHPDAGGNEEDMITLNLCREKLQTIVK